MSGIRRIAMVGLLVLFIFVVVRVTAAPSIQPVPSRTESALVDYSTTDAIRFNVVLWCVLIIITWVAIAIFNMRPF